MVNMPRYSKETEGKLLEMLYTNLPKSVVAIIFNATFFLLVLWPVVDTSLLSGWYGMMVLVALIRFMDARNFKHHRAWHEDRTWHNHMQAGVVLSALLWGSIPLLFFPEEQTGYQMFVVVLIVGMSAGAVTTLAADLRMSLIYLYTLLIPLAYRLFWQEGVVYTALFALTLMFIGIVSSASRQFNAALMKTFETLELYRTSQQKLTESEQKLRMIFEQTPAGIFYYDTDLKIIDCNSALSSTLTADKTQLIGLDMNRLPDQRLLPVLHGALTSGIQVYEGPYHTQISGKTLSCRVHDPS